VVHLAVGDLCPWLAGVGGVYDVSAMLVRHVRDRRACLMPVPENYVLKYPSPDDDGTYLIKCSCGRWEAEGTAKEVTDAGRKHDDSPRTNHIVSIAARLS
jgi:hypothetical protein